MLRRVSVIGVSGSGKTTFARELATKLGHPHFEMDALFHEDGWQQPPREVFRARIDDATAGDCWVIDGNYSSARDIVWGRADTIIWLDYPLTLIMWRLWWRTLRRIFSREKLWGKEIQETWRTQFLSRDSLFLWALQTYQRRRREYPQRLAQPEYAHLHVERFRSPRSAQRWLDTVSQNTAPTEIET